MVLIMPVSREFLEFLKDQLAGVGAVAIRPMFGGAGVYAGGVMFALVADETLYLKADAGNQPDFEAEGMAPFTYEGKGKPVRMSYWQAPDRLFDDPEELLIWARRALNAALRSKK